jgi:16S rRNA (cytosine967-C5)-methyltransferase
MDKDTRPTLSLKAAPKKARLNKGAKNRPKKGNFTSKKAASPKTTQSTDSRLIAFNILDAIIKRQQMLEAAIGNSEGFKELETRDKALVRLIVASCLRRHGQLNAILNPMISPQTADQVKLVLKMGITQLLFLDLSQHAATDTAVELVKKIGFERQSGLVNAVLRRVIREKDAMLAKTAITDNLPAEIKARWDQHWGPEKTAEIARLAAQTPPLDITGTGNIDALAGQLGGTPVAGQTIRCTFDGDIRNMAEYAAGSWWVQDAAAALPVRLMGDVSGKQVWDLCAAPGGKTAQLIARGAEVTAIDKEAPRMDRLRSNLKRLNMTASIKKADILDSDFDRMAKARPVDMILLDAPCSATGTIRRRPDILVRDERPDLASLQEIQIEMLKNCLGWVKTGGIVLYATCSLEPEEGEEVVSAIIHHRLAEIRPFTATELGPFASSLTAQGWARILPDCLAESELNTAEAAQVLAQGNDGFFIARLTPITP